MARTQAYTDGRKEQTEIAPLTDAPRSIGVILGTRTFSNVLYSKAHAERLVPVDALTGDRTRQVEGSVEQAKQFVANDPRRVAVPQNTEPMIETQSAPYVSTVFYDSKVVRGTVPDSSNSGRMAFANDGRELERTYRAADRSES